MNSTMQGKNTIVLDSFDLTGFDTRDSVISLADEMQMLELEAVHEELVLHFEKYKTRTKKHQKHKEDISIE
eukprot:TRINITY_DN11659_c0_g1_i1.p2 TRINITY_DN11659_c0_g1~~TRINITY_DN11659_c0_g1_i1.p2  ORF type:complete len:71 (+),score=10.71 TRINITY_DN11659_c0_g1_i1:189-401(+)